MKAVTDRQTILDLEFDKILDWCAKYALSEKTQKRVIELVPISSYNDLQRSIQELQEFRDIRETERGFPALDFEDLEEEIRFLKIKNAVIPLAGILKIHQASYLNNTILGFFEKAIGDYNEMLYVFKDTHYTMEIIEPIERVIDASGKIKDTASPQLKDIRVSIRNTHRQIQKNFDKELRKLSKTNLLAETKETVINNRRVLSVKSSYKKQFSGHVLGSSKTGNVAHIEPRVNIELNTELDHLHIDEEKEIHRILRELTRILASYSWLIDAYNKSLHELDFISAKYKLARDMKAVKPHVSKQKRIDVLDAIHPLLKRKNQGENKPTFGQNIQMDESRRMLVISGPNAGGKSITLKTLGLFQLMVQSGMFIPAKENNTFCLFSQIYSEIGDNQSIENELSTYSYRLTRMKKFLAFSNPETLLLLDEFGTGSDPDLGGALAEAFFESLYRKKIFAILTTHYSNIKSRAVQLPQAVNGCMLFNPINLQPLFRFEMGSPGSSFTFEVAKINGVSESLIEKAKKKLNKEKLRFNELLSDLQGKTNLLEKQIKEYKKEADEYKEKADQIESYKEKLQTKYDKLNQSSQVHDSQLLAGKKMLEFISQYKTAQGKKINEEISQKIINYLKEQKTKTEAKKKANKPKRKLSKKQVISYQQEKIIVGSKVKIISTKQLASVDEIKGKQTTLVIGNTRIKVALDQLIWVS